MRFDPALKVRLKLKFQNQSFSLRDVINFIEPYFEWNEKAEKEKALKSAARQFLGSMKDEDGIRVAVAYPQKAEDGLTQSMLFSFVDLCLSDEVLEKQEKYINKKADGFIRTARKIQRQRFKLKYQPTLFSLDWEKESGRDAR